MKQHFCSAENSLIQYEKECNWCGEKAWVGLTVEEIHAIGEIYAEKDGKIQMWGLFAVAIEEKLKEKNA